MNWTAFFITTTLIYGVLSTACLMDDIIREKGFEKNKARIGSIIFTALLTIPGLAVGLIVGWLQ